MGAEFSTASLSIPDTTPATQRRRIQIRQKALTSVLVALFIVASIMWCFSLITGYCVPATIGGIGTFTAVPHGIFLLAPFIVVVTGLVVTRFDAMLNVESIARGFPVLYVVSALCGIAFVVEFGMSMVEVVQCVTTLCVQNVGFLIAELVGEAVIVILCVWIIVWTYLLSRDWSMTMGSFLQYTSYKSDVELQRVVSVKAVRSSILKK